MIQYHAHLFIHRGRLAWSGYQASGDTKHAPYSLVVDIGRAFLLTSEDVSKLYLIGPGTQHFETFTPDSLALAARRGMFGFRIVAENEPASRKADKARAASSKDRRRRIQLAGAAR
jgi:hypothetical protein